jgi:NAD(P)-dependent dehydrogenase (short-subunit alcohol dehydrogenase family)
MEPDVEPVLPRPVPVTTGLAGRCAMVTGGSRGIGRAAALALGRLGADVAVVARSLSQVAGVAEEIRLMGRRSIAVSADLSASADLPDLVMRVGQALSPVDILVNNAAVIEPAGRTAILDPAAWDAAIRVNLTVPACLSIAVLPWMLRLGWGRIVNVSSRAALTPGLVMANAYSASKAGLEQHTLNLAREIDGTGVTAHVVRPGRVDTGMQETLRSLPTDSVGEPFHRNFVMLHESGQLRSPEQAAALIVDAVLAGQNGLIWEP